MWRFAMPGQQQSIVPASPEADDDHRVIQFRPRTLPKPAAEVAALPGRDRGQTVRPFRPRPWSRSSTKPSSQIDPGTDGGSDPVGDFHEDRRITASVAALVFVLLLTAVAVWLATTLNDMRRTQDCILVGRRDCAKLPILTITPLRDAKNM